MVGFHGRNRETEIWRPSILVDCKDAATPVTTPAVAEFRDRGRPPPSKSWRPGP